MSRVCPGGVTRQKQYGFNGHCGILMKRAGATPVCRLADSHLAAATAALSIQVTVENAYIACIKGLDRS